MSYQLLTNDNQEQLLTALRGDGWVVACLCAGWCGSCREYALAFADWAQRSPEHHFVWIDIEDQADLVGDLDIDNFPTLLMQRGPIVGFFGAMEPDTRQAERLLQAQTGKSLSDLQTEVSQSAQRQEWQECNLLARLDDAASSR